jgi:hypothetical protein
VNGTLVVNGDPRREQEREVHMSERVTALLPASCFEGACSNLKRFVLIEAAAMVQMVGFGWQADRNAPGDYRGLLRAYASSQATGRPLPVSDEYTEPSIYGSKQATHALRFWHDLIHVRLHHGFDLDGELEVGAAQLEVLAAAGFPPGSLEYELLHGETVGQTVCAVALGKFPSDQVCFGRLSLESGLTAAIRTEIGHRAG